MKYLQILIVKIIRWSNWVLSGLSMRLTKWTLKSSQYVHPKHLLTDDPLWLKYFDSDDNVLDIGCSNGQRDFQLAQRVKHITAFDYDPEPIAVAEKFKQEKSIKNIDFNVFSAEEKLPYANDSYDKILFIDVIEHLYNRDQIMSECYRVLKPGGQMILAAPNTETPWKLFQKKLGLFYYSDHDHKIEYSKEELLNEHRKFNFKIIEMSPIVYDFPFTGLVDFVGGISLTLYQKIQNWKRKVAMQHPEKSIGFMVVSSK